MNRVCIFAHYDKDNIIDDYVIFYLKALRKDFNKIIFVSDSNLNESEKAKLDDLCDYVQAYHHGEYDWGSYKYGYIIAKKNNILIDADELLLCNDSVYGPVNNLSPLLEKMSCDDCDFYGLYENNDGIVKDKKENHLQSWFLLLKKNVINSSLLDDFISSVTHIDDKNELIQKYEVGFTQSMQKDFKYKALFSSEKSNAVTQAAPILLKEGFPFIKTVVLRKYDISLKNIDTELVNLIKKHSKRVGCVNALQKFFKTLAWKSKMKRIKIIKNI